MRPEIGIVTVLYNSDDVIDDFFASLARQRGVDFKLYVIDNSPTPSGLDRCRELARQLDIASELVFNNANVGVARGNNQGIELALRDGCSHVLLSNNDTEFPAGTLTELLRAVKDGEQVATPKILYYGAENLIWYAGGRIDEWTMRTPHIGQLAPDRGQFDVAGHTPYAPTCFLLMRSEVFRQVGMMDERYFVYYDDTDFVWRLGRQGISIRYVPTAIVRHKVSTSTGGKTSPFTVYYTNRNRIYFIRKNLRGLRRLGALGYALLTRLPNTVGLPWPDAKRLWAGVKEGLALPVNADAR